MAGKHVAAWQNSAVGPAVGFAFNERVTKAYAEGRAGIVASGHAAGSPAAIAFLAGNALRGQASEQFETATLL